MIVNKYLIRFLILLTIGIVCTLPTEAYDRQAVDDYANTWWNSCNHTCGTYSSCTPWSYWGSECCGYPSQGGDCANFTSQSVLAGGHSDLNGGLPCRGYPCGREEIGAKNLGDCLVQKGWTRTCGYHQAPPADIQVGDVLVYHTGSCSDSDAHATVVTSVNGTDVRISCHSSNQHDVSYTYLSSSKPYYEWLHYPSNDLCGALSGTLSAGTYTLSCDIYVNSGAPLHIMPGVTLNYNGHSFTVNGELLWGQ
ncbi:hypothetical protein U27_04720 [Candidatus Vecturithrix granuli]|uniref:Putative amidase domain-containing protein n=1 Tax=Vecturithrix granuli TaxID=1499967 RepID=A0A081BZJ8_VECG1|nr:hypothetical protein U27_04720 [Candidatus Vecturithrix granuli]